ncbi:MAG: sigma-70 family RNA polymerase sigma factor [Myxococcota bacterium]
MQDASISRYIDRVRAIPALSAEEEVALARRAREGDQQAQDKLAEANLRYVAAIALRYRRYGVPLGDLIAEGSVGLMHAVRKFDPDRGVRFVTYAGHWIKAYVLETVCRSQTLVGAGGGPFRSKLFFRIRRERARVASLTRDPDERLTLLAERLDLPREKVQSLLTRLDGKDVSLDLPAHDDGRETLADGLVANVRQSDEVAIHNERKRELDARLAGALEVLDERERFIIENRLLVDEDDVKTLATLGAALGVSRERARQLEKRAKEKLGAQLRDLAA